MNRIKKISDFFGNFFKNPHQIILNKAMFLFLFICITHSAFAASSSSAYDPGSGNDPWALFQFMISLGTEVWYVIKIVLLISGVVGLIFIILGLLKVRAHALDSQGSGGHLKHGIILIILGGVLFGVPTWIQLTGNSLFGSAPAPVTTQQDVNCDMVNGQYNTPGSCGIPCSVGTESNGNNGCSTCDNGSGNSVVGGGCSPCGTGQGTSGGQCTPCTGKNGVVNGVCAPCDQGWGLSGGVCLNCPEKNQIVGADGTCQSCPGGQGYSNGQCNSCGQGFGSNTANANGQCVPCNGTGAFSEQQGASWVCVMCPSGSSATAGNPASSSCQCSDPNAAFSNAGAGSCTCSYASQNGHCVTSCDPGFESGGQCVANCPSEEVASAGTCVKTCPSTAPFTSDGVCSASCSDITDYVHSTCVTQCPAGTVYDSSKSSCALSCSDGVEDLTGACVHSCPAGQLTINGRCYAASVSFPSNCSAGGIGAVTCSCPDMGEGSSGFACNPDYLDSTTMTGYYLSNSPGSTYQNDKWSLQSGCNPD